MARSFRESGDAFIRWTIGGGLADEAMAAGARVLILGALTAAAATALATGLGPLFAWTTGHLRPSGNLELPGLISIGTLLRGGRRPWRRGGLRAGGCAARRPRRRPRSRALPAAFLTLAAAAATLTASATVLLARSARKPCWAAREPGPPETWVHLTVDFAGRSGSVPPEQALDRLMRRLALDPAVGSAGYADHLPDTPRGSYIRGESVDGNERAPRHRAADEPEPVPYPGESRSSRAAGCSTGTPTRRKPWPSWTRRWRGGSEERVQVGTHRRFRVGALPRRGA